MNAKMSRCIATTLLAVLLLVSGLPLACADDKPIPDSAPTPNLTEQQAIQALYDGLIAKAAQLQGDNAQTEKIVISMRFASAVNQALRETLEEPVSGGKTYKWVDMRFDAGAVSSPTSTTTESLKGLADYLGNGLWSISIGDWEWQLDENTGDISALNGETATLLEELTVNTRVLEKNIITVASEAIYSQLPQARDTNTLKFQLATGNRVEGEVALTQVIPHSDGPNTLDPVEGEKYLFAFAFVKDPYGNKIVQTAKQASNVTLSDQVFPWRFAFTAATAGEFALEVNTGAIILQGSGLSAHLKVTIYS